MARFGHDARTSNRAWIRKQRMEREKEERDIEKPFCCVSCNFRGTEDQAKIHEEKMQIQLVKAFKKLEDLASVMSSVLTPWVLINV